MPINNREHGNQGESAVVSYLLSRGYDIAERNYRCKQGEIDIIARPYSGCLVFVEVKTRSGNQCGSPIEAVTRSKRLKIVRTAQHYLIENNLYDAIDVRFDIAEVFDEFEPPQINYVENAFISGE